MLLVTILPPFSNIIANFCTMTVISTSSPIVLLCMISGESIGVFIVVGRDLVAVTIEISELLLRRYR